MGYWSGTTNSIQTQLNAKRATLPGGTTSITSTKLTVSRTLLSDASGTKTVLAMTNTELRYLIGASSSIQTQMNDTIGYDAEKSGPMVKVIFLPGLHIFLNVCKLVDRICKSCKNMHYKYSGWFMGRTCCHNR